MHRLVLLLVGLPGLLGPTLPALSQELPGGPGELPVQELPGDLGETPLPGEGLESAVNGNAYRLGPGDEITIVIWGPQPITHRIPVTLEGNLLIPYVGEVYVNNLLLARAKEKIREELDRNYRNVEISITLTRLRRFQIHVLGQVRVPGAYIATAMDRVSVAIRRAGGFLDNASQRNILIENGDSLRAEADLYSFLRSGITGTNPYLNDGDRIFVPFAKDYVQVLGDMNATGRIQHLEGDRLSDLIPLAGGFTAPAFLDTLEFARYPRGSADPARFLIVNGGGILPARPADAEYVPQAIGTFSPPRTAVSVGEVPVYSDFLIRPNDLLFVRRIPEIRLRRLVEIQGEVTYPGSYPIEEGTTRLSDLVAMAGGLTPDAFLTEGRLIRSGDVSLQDPEFERLKQIPVADMDEDEYGYFKMKSRVQPGQMVIDFEGALARGEEHENIHLQRGDIVVIPTRKDFVSLLGLVSNPGNIKYRPGLEARDYVKEGGGYADKADKGGVRVIKARSGEWMKPGEAGELEAGDVVYVPQKKDFDFWGLFKDSLLIVAQLATIVLVIDSVSN